MIAAGEPLHVWSTNWGGSGFASDRCRGLLENMTPLIESSGFDHSDFIDYTWDIYTFEGKQYGLPQLTCGSYIYVNKDLFEKAGVDLPPYDWSDTSWTWDELLRMAKQIAHDYDDIGKAEYGIVCQTGGCPIFQLALPWGKDCLDPEAYEEGFYETCYYEDPVVVDSFQFRHDLIWKHKVMPDRSINQALGELGGTFQSNKLAMQGTGGWGHWAYYEIWKKEKAGEQAFRWRACPIPYGDTAVEEGYEGPRGVIYTDPWSITSGLSEDELAASWEFVEYLGTADAGWSYAEVTGTPPVRESLLEDYFGLYDESMTFEETKQGFMGPYEGYGFESSNHLLVRWDELNQTFGNTMDAFWNNPDSTAEEFCPKLDKVMEDLGKKIKEEQECVA
jgi:multiple sugar transport system substrate-binding protein